MLVLSRNPEEDIVVVTSDGVIVFRLLEIVNGRKARIGVQAPRLIRVYRGELLNRARQDKEHECDDDDRCSACASDAIEGVCAAG